MTGPLPRTLMLVGMLALAVPMAASGGAPPSCAERMLQEVGWLDQGAGLARDDASESHPCHGRIQPGALLTSLCTMNFIFTDGRGGLYLGTAGHCVAGVGTTVGVVGVGDEVATVVFDGLPGPLDFALARIHPEFHGAVDPTLCHWGGPSGVDAAPTAGERTHQYGWGNYYSSLPIVGDNPWTRPRVGEVLLASATEFTYLGFAQPGDSGSPIVNGEGQALGLHVRSTFGLPFQIRVDPAPKYATRIGQALAAAEAATGLDLAVVDGRQPFSLLGT